MDILFPQLPKASADGTFKASEVEAYNKNIQEVIKKVANNTSSGGGDSGVGGVSADIIIKYEIESLITHWCLVDPTQLPEVFQVCDGSAWKSGSYAETFWIPKGLTKIPNLCGYGLRSADRSSTQNDPDRNDRRQAVTGQVLTGGITVSLPNFYCNVIKEAIDKGRTVQIGINATNMFGTLSPVSTVTAVDLSTNVVTLTSGSALTVGATSLIIKGDCIGSFQIDQFAQHSHSFNAIPDGEINNWVAPYQRFRYVYSATNPYTSLTDQNNTAPGGAETRIKNISYLPIMYVLLPSQALVNINGEIRNIDALIDKIGANSYVSQIVQNHVTTIYDYAFSTTRASATVLECFTTSITTVKNESKISIDMFISGETYHDGAFILERGINGVFAEIGSPAQAGTRYYGISPIAYDSNNDSTLNNYQVQYIDTPSVPSGTVITYRLKVYGNGGGGFNVNHVTNDSDVAGYERATSNVRLTEFAGTPNINFGDTDVASVSEAKAGVDNTKVITPYGLRQALNAEGSAPVYACRAWGKVNLATMTIQGCGNISGITDRGTGIAYITLTTPMSDANYSVVLGHVIEYSWANGGCSTGNETVNGFTIIHAENGAGYDTTRMYFAVFR